MLTLSELAYVSVAGFEGVPVDVEESLHAESATAITATVARNKRGMRG
jgi:hypothetical protein